MRSILAKSHFSASKLSKSSHWPEIPFLYNFHGKGTVSAFQWELYKTGFSVWRFWQRFAKNAIWPKRAQIRSKTGTLFMKSKTLVFMLSTFWPNRIFESQSCQNRHTGLKFSSKRENSALLKIVQNGLFRSCVARFGQMTIFERQLWRLKMSHLASNSLQNGEGVRF